MLEVILVQFLAGQPRCGDRKAVVVWMWRFPFGRAKQVSLALTPARDTKRSALTRTELEYLSFADTVPRVLLGDRAAYHAVRRSWALPVCSRIAGGKTLYFEERVIPGVPPLPCTRKPAKKLVIASCYVVYVPSFHGYASNSKKARTKTSCTAVQALPCTRMQEQERYHKGTLKIVVVCGQR